MAKENLNYFSAKEKKSINRFKNLRTKTFLPISKFLMKIGMTPDLLSYIGLLLLIVFIVYVLKNPILAAIMLLVHVIIDGFDGPLARLMKKAGDSGAFTDIICDHTGMAIVVITLIFVKLVNPWIAAIYIYIYTIMIIFVIVRNRMKKPAKIIIRTKYYVYILFAIWAIWKINYLDYGLVLFIILM